MDEKTRTQAILLSVLGTVGLLFGSSKRIALSIQVLQMVISEHWEEIWEIIQRSNGVKKIRRIGGKIKDDGKDPSDVLLETACKVAKIQDSKK